MDFFRRPLADQRQIPLNGGPVRWDFKRMEPRLGQAHLHIVGFVVKKQCGYKQAATTGVAVKGIDRPYFYKSVTVARDPKKIMIPAVPAHMLQALQWAANQGQPREVIPPDIAANVGGAPVTTDATEEFTVWLEQPDALEQDDHIWPLAAFRRSGYFEVNVDNPTNFDPTISYDGAHTNTLDLDLIVVKRDEPSVGRDRLYWLVDDQRVGNAAGIEFPAGAVEWLILQPPKVNAGGGDDCNKYTSIRSLNDQPHRIPDQKASTYNVDFARSCGLKTWQDPLNLVTNMKMAVIIGQPSAKRSSQSPLYARSNFRLDVLVSANTTGHRFLAVYVQGKDADELGRIAADSGLPVATAVRRPSANRPFAGAHPERTRFAAVKLLDPKAKK